MTGHNEFRVLTETFGREVEEGWGKGRNQGRKLKGQGKGINEGGREGREWKD